MLVKPEYIHIALHLSRLLSVSHYNVSDLKCNPVRGSSILPTQLVSLSDLCSEGAWIYTQ